MISRPLLVAVLVLTTLSAAVDHEIRRGEEAPEAETGEMEVVLREGTNIAVDRSPDGATLALDLVGRIWVLPASGGRARPITDPFGDARQPQWSPDGERLVFQAYWAGDYDVWTVGPDGTGLEQLTRGPFDDREPTWSPDGARVAFSSDRSGSYDIWELTLASGRLRRLTDDPGNEYTPAYGPEGRRVAYAADGDRSGVWVERGGDDLQVSDAGGGDAYAPSWSPDGETLAFVRIDAGASSLLTVDAQGRSRSRAVTGEDQDVFPFRSAWTEDGRLLYTADGGIRSRPASGGAEDVVAFTAVVSLDRPTYRKRLRAFEEEGPRPVRGIVSPSHSPDGRTVAFVALGDLWSMPVGGTPRRLTDDAFVEVDPAWSPDGRSIVYGSDRDGDVQLYLRDLASGAERRLTTEGGSAPAWSPDGGAIAFAGGRGEDAGLRVLDVESGRVRTVRRDLNDPGRPTWSPDGRRIVVSALRRYSTRFREGVNQPLSVPVQPPLSEQEQAPDDLDGWEGPRRQDEGERWLDFPRHASFASRGTEGPVWSPDGGRMAYVASGVLWVAPVSAQGDPVGPPRRLNNEISSDPSWSGDGRSLLYLAGDGLRRVSVASGRIDEIAVPLSWSRRVVDDRYVLHAGRVFDGTSSQLRRDMDIVIDGNRIVRMRGHDDALHDRRVVDASDGVVIPGLLEMHMHGGLGSGESAGRQWLAFGVTTVRTPSADPYEMVEAREANAVDRRIQPRVFGTGNTIDGSRVYYAGAPALTSLGQIELAMDRAEALSFDLVKTYVRLSDQAQRRVVADAHAMGMPVTSHELYPGVAYGVDGVEHVKGTSRRGYSPKVSELNRSYQDVVGLLAASGMTLTPTVGIYGGYAVLASDDPAFFEDSRIDAFGLRSPPEPMGGEVLEIRRRMVEDMASLGRRVVAEGGTIVVGTDSPINPSGLSLIAEMQILVEYGGMEPLDVIRATTSISADAMGYGEDLGRVEAGYLADLVVLGDDPLADIRAVRDVRLVISDGRTYTMEELTARPGS
ncbi:MAG: amidohydrolase family protein [Longimicrobiales bacterium]|nr:amidohydrolase family protein [Longimicrobiales bacterium]